MTARITPTINGLRAIYVHLFKKISGNPDIRVSIERNDLEISLNSDRGLEGHEQFTATARENDYRCVYFGMPKDAKMTFLNVRYDQEIERIKLIKIYRGLLLGDIQKNRALIKNYKSDNDQKYSSLFRIEQTTEDDIDLFNAFLFLSRVFKDKTEKSF